MERLGKTATPGTTRMVRIKFSNATRRRAVLTTGFIKAGENEPQLYTRPDLTIAQQALDKKLRGELNVAGKDKFKISRGKIVPRNPPPTNSGKAAIKPTTSPIAKSADLPAKVTVNLDSLPVDTQVQINSQPIDIPVTTNLKLTDMPVLTIFNNHELASSQCTDPQPSTSANDFPTANACTDEAIPPVTPNDSPTAVACSSEVIQPVTPSNTSADDHKDVKKAKSKKGTKPVPL